MSSTKGPKKVAKPKSVSRRSLAKLAKGLALLSPAAVVAAAERDHGLPDRALLSRDVGSSEVEPATGRIDPSQLVDQTFENFAGRSDNQTDPCTNLGSTTAAEEAAPDTGAWPDAGVQVAAAGSSAVAESAVPASPRSSTLWSCFRRFRAVTSFQINELQAF